MDLLAETLLCVVRSLFLEFQYSAARADSPSADVIDNRDTSEIFLRAAFARFPSHAAVAAFKKGSQWPHRPA